MTPKQLEKTRKLIGRLEEIVSDLGELSESVNNAADRMSDKRRETDEGEALASQASYLSEAHDSAQAALDSLCETLPVDE